MWAPFCDDYSPASEEKEDSMKEVINQLIKETEIKIIDILVRAYNSGRIEEDGFTKYEMIEIKKLLFMRSELNSKLYKLIKHYHSEDREELE